MRIIKAKKFNDTIKLFRKFCKGKKQGLMAYIVDRIFVKDNLIMTTDGKIMITLQADFIENEGYLFFPCDVEAKESIEFDIEGFQLVDGKKNGVKLDDMQGFNFKSPFRLIHDEKPISKYTFDFSKYNFEKIASMGNKFSEFIIYCPAIMIKYNDDSECICTINDSLSTGLLDENYGEFKKVGFSLSQIREIIKISNKIEVCQFEDAKKSHEIIAGEYKFVIMPFDGVLAPIIIM